MSELIKALTQKIDELEKDKKELRHEILILKIVTISQAEQLVNLKDENKSYQRKAAVI